MTTTDKTTDKPADRSTDKAPARRQLTPAVDIFESREGFLLVADLPGVKQEDLTVRLEEGELSFEGVRKARVEGAPLTRPAGELVYKRAFTLPGGIDADKIEARLSAGVLHLTLPKAAAFKPRQITVTTA